MEVFGPSALNTTCMRAQRVWVGSYAEVDECGVGRTDQRYLKVHISVRFSGVTVGRGGEKEARQSERS